MKVPAKAMKSFDKAVEAAKTAHRELNDAIKAFNDKVQELFDETLADRLDQYNSVAASLNEQRRSIADTLQSAFDEKSERWRESEDGEAAAELVGAWIGAEEMPDVESECPALDVIEDDVLESLEDMPSNDENF